MVDIQQVIVLLSAAITLGDEIYADVKSSLDHNLTPSENQAVLAQWDENEMRSARDAGITPAGGGGTPPTTPTP